MFRYKLFGDTFEIIHNSLYMKRSDFVALIRSSHMIAVPLVIYCNGKVECDVIKTSDYVVVDIALIGGVRGRKKTEVHLGRECGPCEICKRLVQFNGILIF